MFKRLLGFLVLVGLCASSWMAQAQQAAYYPAIPWTKPSVDNHPKTLPGIAGGCGALFSAPQSVTVGRTFFDPDSESVSTSDSVAVPAHYSDTGGSVSATCYGDIVGLFLSPELDQCQTEICFDRCKADADPGYPVPAKDKTCNDIGPGNAHAFFDNWPEEEKWIKSYCSSFADTAAGLTKCKELCEAGAPGLGGVSFALPAGKVCADIEKTGSFDIPTNVALELYCSEVMTENADALTACKEACVSENATCDDIKDVNPHAWALKYCGKGFAMKPEEQKKLAGCFKTNFPESCKKVGTPVLVNDGDRDAGDVSLEDNWPAGPDQMIAGLIPDPVDSFFPTKTVDTTLFLPVDVVQANFNAATPQLETVILNYFPLNANFFDSFGALADGDALAVMKFMLGLMPVPFPQFFSNPDYQTEGPIFAVMDNFQAGPGLKENKQNECTTKDNADPKSYKNCRSSPVGIQAVNVSNAGSNDLAVLHQNFSSPPKVDPIDIDNNGVPDAPELDELLKMGAQAVQFLIPSMGNAPVAKNYCSNVQNGVFPGKDVTNPSSQGINVGFLNMNMRFATGKTLLDAQIKTTNENQILGYLTWYKNRNDGSLEFDKQPTADNPYRLCVGKSPTHFVKANLDGDKDATGHPIYDDLVVSEFGGFTPSWDPTIFAAFMEVAGGMTFIRDYTGNGGQVLHLPIAPDMGNTHIQHYIDTACGDVDGDGDDDCVATGMDGMGLQIHAGLKELFRVPDVAVAGKPQPQAGGGPDEVFFPWAGDCTVDVADPNKVTCAGLEKFADGSWMCDKQPTQDVNGTAFLNNPANPEDMVEAQKPDLYVCHGAPLDPTCPEFKKENALRYLYKVRYELKITNVNKTPVQVLEDMNGPQNKFPVAGADCAVKDNGGGKNFSMVCTGIPDFDGWTCDIRPVPDPAGLQMTCQALTTARGANGEMPASFAQWPDAFGESDADMKDIVTPDWEAGVRKDFPVIRDAFYACGYDFNINRNSEFAVYMNPGNGAFNTIYPNLHYVDMAQVKVPRIVPDFPMNFDMSNIVNLKNGIGNINVNLPGGQGAAQQQGFVDELPVVENLNDEEDKFNLDYMGVRYGMNVKGTGPNNTIGLGVWPFDVELADLVDKTGAPKPDGLADAVVALNNSHYVAIIASQGGWEPFKGAPTLYFDTSTPELKTRHSNFLVKAVEKVKLGEKLSAIDYLTLLGGLMSGTSYVTVPKDPINGLNEFTQPDARRGIVAIHAFPWRLVGTWLNSLELPIGILGDGAAQKIGGGCAGPGGAGGCAGPGGGGGCALIPGGES